jgi:LysM repeat protein
MGSRLTAVVAFTVLPVVTAACAGSATSGPTTVQREVSPSTAYLTLPPVPTTTPNTGTTPPTTGPKTYTVQSGDAPITVAKEFGVTLDALNAANAGTEGYAAFYEGLTIIIPGGSPQTTTAGSTGSGTSVAGTPGSTPASNPSETSPTQTSEGEGGCSSPGSYTVQKGDYPLAVARKFGVDVEALNAANADTKGYAAFYEGLKIVIPC